MQQQKKSVQAFRNLTPLTAASLNSHATRLGRALPLAMGCPRLLKEYREIKSAKVVDKEIELELTDETDIFQWTARIQGPKDSPYEGGTFELSLKCPDSYPLAPPKVLFVTPVFHPNVLYKTGEICLDILKPDAWTPAWTLQSVCRAVAALLSHPEADSPLYA